MKDSVLGFFAHLFESKGLQENIRGPNPPTILIPLCSNR
jgi:hypothetical protein